MFQSIAIVMTILVLTVADLTLIGVISFPSPSPSHTTGAKAVPTYPAQANNVDAAAQAAASANINVHRIVDTQFSGILAFGDSVTEGYLLTSPQQHYTVVMTRQLASLGLLASGASIREFGVPALSVSGGAAWLNNHPQQAQDALWSGTTAPDLVIFQLGLNDWLHSLGDAQQFNAGMAQILPLLAAHAAPGATLVCLTPWGGENGSVWDGRVPNAYNMRLDDYKALLIPLCRAYWKGPVAVVDLTPIVLNPAMHNRPDEPHPNPAGHQAIADAIVTALRGSVRQRPRYWDVPA